MSAAECVDLLVATAASSTKDDELFDEEQAEQADQRSAAEEQDTCAVGVDVLHHGASVHPVSDRRFRYGGRRPGARPSAGIVNAIVFSLWRLCSFINRSSRSLSIALESVRSDQ